MATYKPSQDVLVSGTNIKTINTASVLGSGNLTVTGSGGYAISVDTPPSTPSTWDDEFDNASIDGKWVDFNLASGTKSEDLLTKCMIIGAAGTGLSQQGIVQTSPTGNFTVITKLGGCLTQSASFRYGIVVAESTIGKNFTFTHIAQNVEIGSVLYEVMNTPTTRASYDLQLGTMYLGDSGYLKLYIYNDSGTWKANTYFSKNGIVYTQKHTAIAIGFTPAYVGLVVCSESVAGTNPGYFEYFRVTE